MKSQKGITLISLTVYIIAMVIVISILTVMSTYFYTNISDVTETINPITEYTKFNSFFSDEVNRSNIKVLEANTNGTKSSYVAFDNGVQYTFMAENKGIYRNNIKIAKGIESCTFEYIIEEGKGKVIVNMEAKGNFKKTQKYTLNN